MRWRREKKPATIKPDDVLPAPLAQLVAQVARRTRLWRRERADVAAELTSHFCEGLDAGRTADELADGFGDPSQAAQLIRRARKRQRPLAWRIARRVGQGTAVFFGVYLIGVLYFMSGRPSPTVDYLAVTNAKAAGVPDADRAWPHYRSALLALGPALEHNNPRPGDPGWDTVEAYLDTHAATLEDIRRAAAMPGLGFIVKYEVDDADRALWPGHEKSRLEAPMNLSLYAVLLPYLSDMRRLGIILELDAHRAVAEGDGATAAANVQAMLGLGAHAREVPFLINDLVGAALAQSAVRTTGELLAETPESLDDTQLRTLAHRLGGSDALYEVRFDGERYGWRDLVQRIYTDDGDGDGRLTPTGLRAMEHLTLYTSDDVTPRRAGVASLAGPLLLATMMSRREALEMHERLLVQYESFSTRPMWEWGDSDLIDVDTQLDRWHSSLLDSVRYYPLILLMPALGKAGQTAQAGLARRDAVLAALALELDRRRRGAWAPSLDALVPDLLPRLPRDGFDGAPLRYALVDGHPVLYSIGNDRDDDGGRPHRSSLNNWSDRAAQWRPTAESPGVVDADWVLWPPAERIPLPPPVGSAP